MSTFSTVFPPPPLTPFYPSADLGEPKREEFSTPTESGAGALPWESKVKVLVGATSTLQAFQETLRRCSSPLAFELEADTEIIEEAQYWSRDHRVISHSGQHLIPKQVGPPVNIELSFMNALASSFLCIISEKGFEVASYYGIGLEDTTMALDYAKRTGTPYKQSRCCIEGGNVILSTTPQGKKVALIGVFTLCLTYMVLEEEEFFDSGEGFRLIEEMKHKFRRKPLPHSFLLAARNLKLYDHALSTVSTEALQLHVNKVIKTPLVDAERQDPDIIDEARTLQAAFEVIKGMIAEELGLPLNHIAFVHQIDFHLDMSMCLMGNAVFVHDSDKAVEQLDMMLSSPKAAEDKILVAYRKTAHKSINHYRELNDFNQPLIEALGLRMVRVPGQYGDIKNGIPVLNFFNGLELPSRRPKERIYALPPCPFPPLYERFIRVVQESLPQGIILKQMIVKKDVSRKDLDDEEEDEEEVEDVIGALLSRYAGGLHCMTNLRPLPPLPLPKEESPKSATI